MEKTKNELDITRKKLAGREKSLTELTERKSLARKSLDEVKQEKLQIDIEHAKLTTDKSKLEEDLNDAIEKITHLESQLNLNIEKTSGFEQIVLDKDKELQKKEEELLNKVKELLNKDETIQDLRIQIEDLKNKLDEEIEYTNKQINKFKMFETQMSETINATKVIEKIKQILELKGFLSDKELESLLDEIGD